jgi:iron complex transport system permease protein
LKILALAIVTLGTLVVAFCLGETNLSWHGLQQAVLAPQTLDPGAATILWDIRLPRLLSAAIVGMALSLAGYLLQSLSGNDLADPYLTGVASGAALGAAIAIFCGLPFAYLPTLAFGGGIAASALVVLASSSSRDRQISMPLLLLSGIALSTIVTAAINLMQFLSASNTAVAARGLDLWLMGGLSGRSWPELYVATSYILPCMAISLLFAKPLSVVALGQDMAASLGIKVGQTQVVILALAVLLTSAAVSLSGLIGFVGLIAPHLARRLVKHGFAQCMIASALCGAIVLSASDLIARTANPSQEVPLGCVMALLGGPFFLLALRKGAKQSVV